MIYVSRLEIMTEEVPTSKTISGRVEYRTALTRYWVQACRVYGAVLGRRGYGRETVGWVSVNRRNIESGGAGYSERLARPQHLAPG